MKDRINFKEETLVAIKESGHIIEDVEFVGTKDGKYRMNIDKFMRISNFEYDNGYGSENINSQVIVYFKDKSYLAREEYDGSEWWTHRPALNYSKNDEYEELRFNQIAREEYVIFANC
jgi:hypothetical protein